MSGVPISKCRMSCASSVSLASWSSGSNLALGSGGPGFKSWLCQVQDESLGKALNMYFFTPLMCKNEHPTIGSILE